MCGLTSAKAEVFKMW